MDELAAIKQTFFQECDELLADLEAGLLALESGSGDADTVNAVFRAVHSVKGGAGAFALEDLVKFAHVFETTLDAVRSDKIEATETVIKVLLRSADMLSDHVAAAKGEGFADAERSSQLERELKACVDGDAAPEPTPAPHLDAAPADEWGFVPQRVSLDDFAPAPALVISGPATWRIAFKPHPALYAKANDAAVLLRELHRLGACEVDCHQPDLPDLTELDPDHAYLSWTIQLVTECPEDEIRDVFAFVDGDCDLTVSRVTPVVKAETASFVPLPAIIVEPPAAPAAPEPAPRAATPPADIKPAADQKAAQAAQAAPTIRVDLDRIDKLIDLVGELVINQSMLSQRAAEFGAPRSSPFYSALQDLEQLTRNIQDSVMAVRAQPVKSVFQRMPRLVREVATLTSKEVRLETAGEGTEVDKTVIERLSDPITHMIRNAIDHGIESPEVRLAAGKPSEGCVRLSAAHRSGRIVIEVADDGAGINRERVFDSAVKKGLIRSDVVMIDDEIDNLIFLPGFSTAAEVSNISGRGVGMDVVKRSIQALGGRISISSVPGQGSRFTLSLPLTLAVLDGMVVTVGEQTYIIPLTAVVETLRPKPAEVRALGPDGLVVEIRDWHVPLVDVGRMLDRTRGPVDAATGVCLLVESEVGGRAALVVDSIEGQKQVVIKSLEANYDKVDLIAAATILGDGRVALILDVDAVIARQNRDANRSRTAPPLALAS